jgi:hypothetical protein
MVPMSKASSVSSVNRVRSRLATAEAALREAVMLMSEADCRPDQAALERVAGHIAGIRAELRRWTVDVALRLSPHRTWEHGAERAIRALLSARER